VWCNTFIYFIGTTKEVQIVETKCEPSESIGNSVPKELSDETSNKQVKSSKPDTQVQVGKKKSQTKQSKNNSSQGMKQSSLTSFFKTK